MTYFSMIGENPSPAGRGHTSLAWQWWTYRTADGWLAIGGVDPARWPGFCRAIGREDLVTDERFDNAGKRISEREALNAAVEEHLTTRKTEEWLPALEAEDIFCAPVLNYQRVLSHEQVRANGYTAEMRPPARGTARPSSRRRSPSARRRWTRRGRSRSTGSTRRRCCGSSDLGTGRWRSSAGASGLGACSPAAECTIEINRDHVMLVFGSAAVVCCLLLLGLPETARVSEGQTKDPWVNYALSQAQ